MQLFGGQLMSDNRPIQTDSQRSDGLTALRSNFQQNINGRVITSNEIDGHVFVTLDGKPFAGTFIQAIQIASQLPIRWNGIGE
jgi:hypothetical protein